MRSAFDRALQGLVLFAAFAAWGACASPAPLVVERLDVEVAADAAAQVVAGAYDSSFKPQPYAALIPSRDHGVWYRIRLSSD